MKYEDVLAFAAENPVFTIATIDGDQPRVRAFLTVLFDDGRIYFTTGTTKKVYSQLAANPRVELCYLKPDFGVMMRVTAVVEEVDDREKKRKLVNERDYLKGVKEDDPQFKLFRLASGSARFWTLKDNLKERTLETVEF